MGLGRAFPLWFPPAAPPHQRHRRFQQWVRSGVVKGILTSSRLKTQRQVVEEAFIDGCFAPAKKGGTKVGKTKRGNGTKIMAVAAVADRHGLTVAVCVER